MGRRHAPPPPEILRKSHIHQRPRNGWSGVTAEEAVEWSDHQLGKCDAETCPYCKMEDMR